MSTDWSSETAWGIASTARPGVYSLRQVYHIISYYIILCYFVSYYITSGKLAHSSRWETDPYIAKIAHWLKDKEMPSEASPRPALLLSIAITTIIMFN